MMFLDFLLHFNIASLFIFVITIFYIVYRKSYKARSSYLFLWINIVYLIICILDIFASGTILPIVPKQIFMFLYYLLKYTASIMFLLYLILITNSEDMIRNKRNAIFFSIPYIITVGFLISNLFTGQIYYFEGEEYYRGNLIFVFYGLSFIYVVIAIIWVIRFHKVFDLSELFAITSVYILSIGALIIQYFRSEVLIEILSSSLGFLLLNVTVERSQLIMDPRTGLKNKNNFDRVIYTIFKRKKENGLILFYINNYSVLYEKYNYDVAIKKIRGMLQVLSKLYPEIPYECYYLGSGTIAILTKKDINQYDLARKINDRIINSNSDTIVFNINYLLCVANIPTDFESMEELNKFIYDFYEYLDIDSKIVSISNIKNSKEHNALFSLDKILDRVIENKEIYIEFQPILNNKVKKYTAIEALARINDSEFGKLNAKNFISFAEKKDKIYDIDMLVIENVYKYYHDIDFKSLGIENIAINISPQTLVNHSFRRDLSKLELLYDVEKNYIVFEIRERESTTSNQAASDMIKAMIYDGYLFALDNFGVGCIPIEELVKTPFDTVKFDSSFTDKIENKDTYVIIENTIELFRNIKKDSIFSGIENEKEAKKIESLNPDYLQGFYYSIPLSIDKLILFLKENK